MATSVLKGSLIDVPLALTEGLHNLPKLYDENVRRHDKVTDWKSGTAEADKVCIVRVKEPYCSGNLRLSSSYFAGWL